MKPRIPAIICTAILTLMLGWICPVAAQGNSAGAGVTDIRLRDQTTAAGPNLTLGQIATLSGPLASILADTVITPLSESSPSLSVTLKEVEKILADLGIHRGKVTLGGFDLCRVKVSDTSSVLPTTAKPTAAPMAAIDQAPAIKSTVAVANPSETMEVTPLRQASIIATAAAAGPRTLAELIAQRIAALGNVDVRKLSIAYSPADQRMLAQEIGTDLIEIQPQGRGVPGRLPLTIRRYQGEKLAQTLHVTADVATVHQALVAARTIQRGQTISAEDLTLEQVSLTTAGQPLTDAGQAQGQVAKALLRKGTVLLAEHVSAPVWVKRGELISVRCVQGAIVVRTAARAMEDGSQDQVIKVQNEKSRLTYLVRLTSPREGLMCEQPDSSTTTAAARNGSDQGGVR